jgi:enoyl-CoA hydratase/carnithine racemase
MVALSRNVWRKHTVKRLLTGEMTSAEDAVRIDLVNSAVAHGDERDSAVALARKISSKSSYVLKIGKAAFYRQAEMGLADAYKYASQVMTENMMARDAEEGMCAFIEKRDPKWEDR